MKTRHPCISALVAALLSVGLVNISIAENEFVPAIVSDWRQIAGDPNVDPYTTSNQQPVDFGIWQAADGSWQLWSCIRSTSYPGHTRLFHGWESDDFFATDWRPAEIDNGISAESNNGIKMVSDTSLGEASGGMQAPHVVKEDDTYHMFYGTWNHIAHATSADGKHFDRVKYFNDTTTSMFGDGHTNPRDPMTIKIDDTYYVFYTAHTGGEGKDYLRTIGDLSDTAPNNWSAESLVAFGGSASGTGSSSAECPFVYYHAESNAYYLFRTQRYGSNPQTSVYRSTDPTYFGVDADADNDFVGYLPVAAPEIVEYGGQTYIAALNLGLDGIRIAEFDFVEIDPNAPPLFTDGGAWQLTERRMNVGAPDGFEVNSVADADALLAMNASDPRVAVDISFQSPYLNFNHDSGNIGHFPEDDAFPGGGSGNYIAVQATGEFQLDTDGLITFGLTVNDGARLLVDGQQVIFDDTANPVEDHFGSIQLDAGKHSVDLVYFQHQASAVLELYLANSVGEYTQLVGASAPPTYWSLLGAAPVLGDFNGDYLVNEADVNLFVQALTDRSAYETAYPDTDPDGFGDFNSNGLLDLGDLSGFVAAVSGSASASAAAVPEPALLWTMLGLMTIGCRIRPRRRQAGRLLYPPAKWLYEFH